MGGRRWIRQERAHRIRAGTEGDEEEAASEREVLEEIPEQRAPPALAAHEEVAGFPKLLPKDRRGSTITREHEGCEPVRHARDNAERHDDLDKEADEDKGTRDTR